MPGTIEVLHGDKAFGTFVIEEVVFDPVPPQREAVPAAEPGEGA
jgi:hypothetical protein